MSDDPKISAISDLGSPMLVGALPVTGGSDGEGNLTGITDEDAAYIRKRIVHMGTRRHPEGWQMLTQVAY
ncbi:MAG: hypothetical protein J5586_01730 [Clostridia bacterium]|nr:hypothetical protein [Clostridia bacterium]